MPFNPTLIDAISRIRFAVGDTNDAALLLKPGGETTYAALLTANSNNERAAMRQTAGALATYYATKANRISDLGSSLSWDERVDQWNRIATGEIDALPPDPAAPTLATSGPRIGQIIAGTGWRPR